MNNPTFSPAISGATNYHRWIMSSFDGFVGARVAEIGIGHGEFKRLLPERCEYVGIDIDESLVEAARRNHSGGCYVKGDVSRPDLVERLGPGTFDTVMCFNVLEHIEDDQVAIDNMLRLLRPGGHLLLFVPALPRLYGELDRLAGHQRRYTHETLTWLVRPNDGKIEKITYFNSVGGVGWYLNRFIRYRSLDASLVEGQIRIFDRIICPVARVVDVMTRRFFGQSIVAVVRRT